MTALATSSPPTATGARLLTAADLAALPTDLPSGTVKYELDNGRLVVMAPPAYIHARCEGVIVEQLRVQGEHCGHGQACGEVGVQLRRNPDRVVGPDAAFIANRSLPVRLTPEGYLESMPDLVVEVRSKNDTLPEIEQKVNEYLQAGVRVVWVPDPERQTVTSYRNGQPPQVFAVTDTLTVPDVIPGFAMPVQDVFAV